MNRDIFENEYDICTNNIQLRHTHSNPVVCKPEFKCDYKLHISLGIAKTIM